MTDAAPKRRRFSEAEVGYVVKNYARLGPIRVAQELGRPKASVIQLGRRLNLHAKQRHSYNTEELDRLIHERYADEGGVRIAKELGVPRVTVNVRAATIGVHRRNKGSRKLTERKVAHIKYRLAQREKASDLAREYGITTSAVSAIKRGKAWHQVRPEDPSATSEDIHDSE